MKSAAFVLALALTAPPAFAQNIPMVSGGIGSEEQAHIAQVQSQYSLKAVFTVMGGDYLTDVAFTVRDPQANILVDSKTTGPYLLLGLPDGTFEIEAIYAGQTQVQKVTIKGGVQKSIQFRFVSSDQAGHN